MLLAGGGYPFSADYLVVAGGGGGGGNGQIPGSPNATYAGAGGAGGYRTGSNLVIFSNRTYTVTVGAGGGGGRWNFAPTAPTNGAKGNDSIISSITSTGGGYGACGYDVGTNNGGSGGSGGGAGYSDAGNSATGGSGNTPSTSPSQGNKGGDTGTYSGAGGGSSSAASGTTEGAGTSNSITGSAVTYGVGGVIVNQANTPNGAANTGNGGGGNLAGSQFGGNGGSGIVVIKYSEVYPAAISTTGSPTYSVSGGYRIYKFTGSGTIRW